MLTKIEVNGRNTLGRKMKVRSFSLSLLGLFVQTCVQKIERVRLRGREVGRIGNKSTGSTEIVVVEGLTNYSLLLRSRMKEELQDGLNTAPNLNGRKG